MSHCPLDTLQWTRSLRSLLLSLLHQRDRLRAATTGHTAFALTTSWQAVPSFSTCLVHLPVTLVTSACPCWPSLSPTLPPAWPHFWASAAPRRLRCRLCKLRISLVQASALPACPFSYFSSHGRPHLCHGVLEVYAAGPRCNRLLGHCWDCPAPQV